MIFSSSRPFTIQPYRGYGTPTRALVIGRALREERIGRAHPTAARWRNALHMLQRLDADPLRHGRIVVHGRTGDVEVRADDEGFFHAWTTPPSTSGEKTWSSVDVTLAAGAHGAEARAAVPILVPPLSARFGVISDMDDTVLQSRVDNLLRAARLMLLENARTRLPFPGVAAFYRALHDGVSGDDRNPIFYVSSSPWNLFDVIDEFLDAQKIPAGPLLLRDWDVGRSVLQNRDHKLEVIREIFSTFSGMPFILVGDTTQQDPEIYAELVREYPGRIPAVYIRNVRAAPERRAAIVELATQVERAGSALVLADDTLAAAKHAAMHGWIAESRIADVDTEKAADEGRTGTKVDAPGTPGDAHEPTTVVDSELSAGEKREIKND
jgi:phosphatidate phosphatase APP1